MAQSLTQLRGLAQSLGCDYSFGDSAAILKQKIAAKQAEMLPPPPPVVLVPPEDQRLRNVEPARESDAAMIEEMLAPLCARGLRLSFEGDQFNMAFLKRTDSGTLRQPPRAILQCAIKLMDIK